MEVTRTELKKVSVPIAILQNPLTVSAIHTFIFCLSGTESRLQSNALKKLLVKNSVEHDDSHSVWKVTRNRLSPVWHLSPFGVI